VSSLGHAPTYPGQAGLDYPPTFKSFTGARRWRMRTVMSVQPRQAVSLILKSEEKALHTIMLCTVHMYIMKRVVFFCRLKLNHKMDVFECALM
jgi:hypothetical protein